MGNWGVMILCKVNSKRKWRASDYKALIALLPFTQGVFILFIESLLSPLDGRSIRVNSDMTAELAVSNNSSIRVSNMPVCTIFMSVSD